MFQWKSFKHIDYLLLFTMLAIIVYGIVIIGSANGWVYSGSVFDLDYYQKRQLLGLGIGLVLVFFIMICNMKLIKFAAIPIYIIALALLVVVLIFGTGNDGDGVRRWLPLGGISLQPSEVGKFGLIIMLSYYFDKFGSYKNRLLVWGAAIIMSLIPLFFVFKEPDLSSSIVIALLVFSVFFTAGLDRRIVLLGLIFAIALVLFMIYDSGLENHILLNDYQAGRIKAWLHPEDYVYTTAYQSIQAKRAIKSGGLFGVGLFNGSGMVPIATTDFIFAIVGEELGLLGISVLFVLYLILIIRILVIGSRTDILFYRLICAGVAGMLGFQAAIHIGVNTAVLPNTGLTLPFFSYGLSSLVINIISIGLVMRIKAEIDLPKPKN